MPEATNQQINILIVDDEKPVADVLKDCISDMDRLVDVCDDGLNGIDHIQRNVYDLIIVDLVMPRIGGQDVLKYAKQANPDALVIIITGYASLETAIAYQVFIIFTTTVCLPTILSTNYRRYLQ